MTREDYEAHKEDYKDNNVSSSAFVLIQDVYIRILEEQLKAKNERIMELEELIKPKTCEWCKYSSTRTSLSVNYLTCSWKNENGFNVGFIYDYDNDSTLPNDFCCNRYEAKVEI